MKRDTREQTVIFFADESFCASFQKRKLLLSEVLTWLYLVRALSVGLASCILLPVIAAAVAASDLAMSGGTRPALARVQTRGLGGRAPLGRFVVHTANSVDATLSRRSSKRGGSAETAVRLC